LVDDYSIFTEKEFGAYTPRAQTPQSNHIRSRYFDWQSKMEQALTKLTEQRRIRARIPKT
jgi:hypothetical protein